jgi:UDP-2,3-diacylglucosamine pyrophosphatase LpxH
MINRSRSLPFYTKPSDTVIISDLHLGRPDSNRRAILSVLEASCERLIVNGDIFDWRHTSDLTPADGSILSQLEELQDQGKAVVLKGNHERFIPTLRKLTKLRFADHVTWEQAGNRLHACHGHQFCGLWNKRRLRANAIRFAQQNGFGAIFVGHDHMPALYREEGVLYGNSGSFAGILSSCLVLTDASIRLLPHYCLLGEALFYEFKHKGGTMEELLQFARVRPKAAERMSLFASPTDCLAANSVSLPQRAK